MPLSNRYSSNWVIHGRKSLIRGVNICISQKNTLLLLCKNFGNLRRITTALVKLIGNQTVVVQRGVYRNHENLNIRNYGT